MDDRERDDADPIADHRDRRTCASGERDRRPTAVRR